MTAWTVDLAAREARHRSGITVRFRPAAEAGAYDGEVTAGLNRIEPQDGARLMRESGKAYMAAIHEARREALIELGRALYGERWQRELAGALGVDDRSVRRWAAGDRSISHSLLKEAATLGRRRRDELAASIAAAERCP